jgi:hypothetical protein
MGMSVDVHSYDYEKLVEKLQKIGASDKALLEKILAKFGERIGDRYILVNNEYWDEYNSYYNLPNLIDSAFGIKDSFDIFLNGEDCDRRDVNFNASDCEVAEELGIELLEEE